MEVYWFSKPNGNSSNLFRSTHEKRLADSLIGKAAGCRYEFESHEANDGWIAQWQSGGLLSRGLKVRIFLHPLFPLHFVESIKVRWVRRSWRVVTVCKTVSLLDELFRIQPLTHWRESGWSRKLSWKQTGCKSLKSLNLFLSANVWRVDREVMCRFAKPRLPVIP